MTLGTDPQIALNQAARGEFYKMNSLLRIAGLLIAVVAGMYIFGMPGDTPKFWLYAFVAGIVIVIIGEYRDRGKIGR